MIAESKLSAKNMLVEAIGLEEENVAKCLLWAERFRSFREDISALLEDLAEEEKICYKKLVDIYLSRFGGDPLLFDRDDIDHIMDNTSFGADHFFVVDEVMGRQVLLDILKSEFETFVFYKQANLKTTDPDLNQIYSLLADCEEQHIHELRCNLEPESVDLN